MSPQFRKITKGLLAFRKNNGKIENTISLMSETGMFTCV